MKRVRLLMLGLATFLLPACNGSVKPSVSKSPPVPIKVLVFSKTAGFRHEDSIPAAIEAIKRISGRAQFHVDAVEDASVFEDFNLSKYRTIVFLSTTGDILDDAQQSAFERFIRAGGGFVGIHSATDTEYEWTWYGGLLGAYFKSHPAIQKATIKVVDRKHPSTKSLPEDWARTDEWYNFRTNPRSNVHILAVIDETTYTGGEMQADHPIAWCHVYEGGRSWYTGGGHTKESFSEPLFVKHVLGGILWTAGAKEGDCSLA